MVRGREMCHIVLSNDGRASVPLHKGERALRVLIRWQSCKDERDDDPVVGTAGPFSVRHCCRDVFARLRIVWGPLGFGIFRI